MTSPRHTIYIEASNLVLCHVHLTSCTKKTRLIKSTAWFFFPSNSIRRSKTKTIEPPKFDDNFTVPKWFANFFCFIAIQFTSRRFFSRCQDADFCREAVNATPGNDFESCPQDLTTAKNIFVGMYIYIYIYTLVCLI